ncbi:MAG: HAEPLYID family protein [Flavobacteriales bacterium]
MNKLVIHGFVIILFLSGLNTLSAQVVDSTQIKKDLLDSLYIDEIENTNTSKKILHAEPLYIDLIRDLGARKGEKEWNIGAGIHDKTDYNEYETLIEYEWAPVDRLGLEVELPFTFYYPASVDVSKDSIPQNRLNSLKLAGQYTFLVDEKHKTSLAIGYLHEFELAPFRSYADRKIYQSNIYNPFFIVAKRWGQNFHTLMYAGPQIFQEFNHKGIEAMWQVNSNFHYMIDGTRNFIGIEINKEIQKDDFDMVLRPQMRVGISNNLMIGIVTGIPLFTETRRISSFLRLIYEPGHRQIVDKH